MPGPQVAINRLVHGVQVQTGVHCTGLLNCLGGTVKASTHGGAAGNVESGHTLQFESSDSLDSTGKLPDGPSRAIRSTTRSVVTGWGSSPVRTAAPLGSPAQMYPCCTGMTHRIRTALAARQQSNVYYSTWSRGADHAGALLLPANTINWWCWQSKTLSAGMMLSTFSEKAMACGSRQYVQALLVEPVRAGVLKERERERERERGYVE